MNPYTNHGKKAEIINSYEYNSKLIGKIGIIVKASDNGYNIWLDYYGAANYTDQIYFFPFDAVKIIN